MERQGQAGVNSGAVLDEAAGECVHVGKVIGYRVMGVPPLDLGRFFAIREDAERAAGINTRVVEVREVQP